jgi:hypothetical protein
MRTLPSTCSFSIAAKPVLIQWKEDMPVFARKEFLEAVGDEYGWLGGFDPCGKLRCVLPYTIVRKAGFRLVRFRCATVTCSGDLSIGEERSFLNSVVQHFRSVGADVIIPASNNAVFRAYPDGGDAAPYGSYVIDLTQPEERLWRNISRNVRLNIGTATRGGVTVRETMECLDEAYALVKETFARSGISFMSRSAFVRYVRGLGEHGKLLVAERGGVIHSCCLFGFSRCTAYAIYAGNIVQQHQGANKLLYWEAIRDFCRMGVKIFDFFGGRVSPEKGSKQEAINLMKERFGAQLVKGFMWKYPLRPWRAMVYSLGVRMLRGGDIVDQERHKLAGLGATVG